MAVTRVQMKVAWACPLASVNEIHVKVVIDGSGIANTEAMRVAGRDDFTLGYIGTVRHGDGIHVLHFFAGDDKKV